MDYSGHLGRLILALTLLLSATAQAQLSFEDAQLQLWHVSDALKSAQAGLASQEHLAAASQSLSYPQISLDVKQMRFSKTLDTSPAQPFLADLPPPISQMVNLPEEFREVDWRTRPIVTATLPLYTGGKIRAGKAVAQAQVSQSLATMNQTKHQELGQLVQAYFGQQMAEAVQRVRQDVRNGLQEHFNRASKLEAQGFATKAQKLQAQVALDDAERALQNAQNDLRGAQIALSGLLRQEQPQTLSTGLFVWQKPLPAVELFHVKAQAGHPGLEQIRAIERQAEEKIKAEKAAFLPTFYAFGQYDFKQEDALITESDWAVGVGMSYQLFSNQNRYRQIKAAQSQALQAHTHLSDSQVKLNIAVERAWLAADNARQQFLLLESALASADENLRLQTLSFQAGQAISLDVIDARLQQGKVRIERAQAAWQFDLALMQLLQVSGQAEQFIDYLNEADKVLGQ